MSAASRSETRVATSLERLEPDVELDDEPDDDEDDEAADEDDEDEVPLVLDVELAPEVRSATTLLRSFSISSSRLSLDELVEEEELDDAVESVEDEDEALSVEDDVPLAPGGGPGGGGGGDPPAPLDPPALEPEAPPLDIMARKAETSGEIVVAAAELVVSVVSVEDAVDDVELAPSTFNASVVELLADVAAASCFRSW